MMDDEKLRRLGLDKAALFLLLLAGLFLAKLIISWRANFKLSEPVILQGSGLAVSVPAGGGFKQSSEGFHYDDKEFRLVSIMQINSNAAISINWRYFLLPFEKTVSERFEANAKDIAGNIEKTGSERFGQFTFDYAEISSAKKDLSLFSGTTQLPDGRTLTLEVIQSGSGTGLAEKIFKTTIASATYTPDNPLAKGKELLDNFREKDLADMSQKKAEQNYYYIKNYTGQTLGFTTDAAGFKAGLPDINSLAAANLYLIKSGINSIAEQSLLRCEPNLQSFKWTSLQSDILINRNLSTSIELDHTGMVSVYKRNTVQNFIFTSTMLPEILFDTFIKSFLQSSFDSVMTDIILSDGRIQPVLVTKTKLKKAAAFNAAFALEIIYYSDNVNHQTTYLDSNGKTLASEVHGRISYKLERSQKESIFADFPEWADRIEQIEQIVAENETQEYTN